MARRTAVIDIGSNSVRMIILERTSRLGFYLLNEVKSRVRISEGSYENGGNLQPQAIERAIAALKEFLTIAKNLKVKKILAVATSAVREAPNKKEFLSRAKKELNLNIKVIEGEKEAFFGAVAAMNLLPINECVTIDIGGGSTDLALIKNNEIKQCVSLDLGTVRLKELFFDKKSTIKEALVYIKEELKKIPPEFRSDTVVGIGGTLRALSKSIMESDNYPLDKLHGFSYSFKEHQGYIKKLIESPTGKLKKFNIKKDRYDTIREGCLIFYETVRQIRAETVITSGAGVREGLFLYDLLRNHNFRFPKNFNPSLKSLLDRFCIDPKASACIYRNSLKIYEALHHLFDPEKRYEKELGMAAKLLNIGIYVDFYEHHKHSSYIILNDLEYGVSHEEIALTALLVRYHKRKLPSNSSLKSFKKLLPPQKKVEWLSFILSLAEILNRDLECSRFEIHYSRNCIKIESDKKLYLAKEEIKNLQKPAPLAVLID